MAKVFISQAAIDAWVMAGKADLMGSALTLGPRRGPVNLALDLTAAFFFQSVSGGGGDANNLVGKVKDQTAALALGAEAYMSSVILGDTAYEVDPGFVAQVRDAGRVFAALRALAP